MKSETEKERDWRCLKCNHDRMRKKKESIVERRGKDKPGSRNLRTSWRWGKRQWASGEISRNTRNQGQREREERGYTDKERDEERVVHIATRSGYTANPIAQCSRWAGSFVLRAFRARFLATRLDLGSIPKVSRDNTAKYKPLARCFLHSYRVARAYTREGLLICARDKFNVLIAKRGANWVSHPVRMFTIKGIFCAGGP